MIATAFTEARQAQLIASGWKRLKGSPNEFYWNTEDMPRC